MGVCGLVAALLWSLRRGHYTMASDERGTLVRYCAGELCLLCAREGAAYELRYDAGFAVLVLMS